MKMEMMKYLGVFFFLFVEFFALQGQVNTIGTIQIDTDKVAEGYTLFAPVTSTTTYLIDNCGNSLNQWESDRPPGLSFYLQENGDLIRTRREDNNTFITGGVAGGIEIFDWEGNRMWQYTLSNDQNVLHHDIAPLPNGNILAIAYELISKEEATALGRRPEYTPDRGLWIDIVIEIQPLPNNGVEIVWEWSSIDHLVQDEDPSMPNFGQLNQSPGRLDINYFRPSVNPESDWMHCNAIDYNEELDQIVLNSKNFNEFFIIDHSTTTSEASGSTGGTYGRGGDFLYRWGNPQTYGMGTDGDRKLFEQHDAHWIKSGKKDEGKIFLFNNGTGRPGGAVSTVDIVDIPLQADGTYLKEDGLPYGPLEADFEYGNNAGEEDISSLRMSGVQQLPNDNVLIVSGTSGLLTEIDDELNVVWQYVIPTVVDDVATQGSNPFANSVFRAYKYPTDFLAFQSNTIVVGAPIELNPNNEFCENTVSTSPIALPIAPFEVINTLVYDQISIRSEQAIDIEIIDVAGQVYRTIAVQIGLQKIDMSTMTEGMYYIKNGNSKYPNFAAIPFIKMK